MRLIILCNGLPSPRTPMPSQSITLRFLQAFPSSPTITPSTNPKYHKEHSTDVQMYSTDVANHPSIRSQQLINRNQREYEFITRNQYHRQRPSQQNKKTFTMAHRATRSSINKIYKIFIYKSTCSTPYDIVLVLYEQRWESLFHVSIVIK